MPIILRERSSFPIQLEDQSFEERQYAALAFCHDDGRQYAQPNIEASEVEGIDDGATLQLTESEAGRILLIERVTIGEDEFATIVFNDSDGNAYARLNVEATEVAGIADSATLQLIEAESELAFSIPADRTQMIEPV